MGNISESLSGIVLEQNIRDRSTVLNEDYCNYVFSEDGAIVRREIRRIVDENLEFPISDFAKLLEFVDHSDMSENAKKFAVGFISETFNNYNNTRICDEVFSEAGLELDTTKFNGDPAANAEFIKSLEEIEKFAGYLVEIFESDYGMADKILERMQQCAKKGKKKEDVQKCTSDCKNIISKYLSSVNSDPRRKQYYASYSKFKELSKSFNNRYSKVTMAEKEKVDVILDQMIDKVYSGVVRDWFIFSSIGNKPEKQLKMKEYWEDMKNIDYDESSNFYSAIIGPLFDFLADTWQGTIGSIRYLRKLFGIELKSTLKWKIVHAIFK